MEFKRKRGSNYTAQEIALLLDLVEKHRSVVEDKRSGAVFLSQKKEVWEQIRNSYNAVQTSGNRSIEQLKVLYDNKKQKARKVLADYQKLEYIKQVTDKDIIDAKKHEKEDKIQFKKTGGGSWCPTATEHDLKVLDLIKNQVTPLVNTCDSAALYFGDTINEIVIEPQLQEELCDTRIKDSLEVAETSLIIKGPSTSTCTNMMVEKSDIEGNECITPIYRKRKLLNQLKRCNSTPLKKKETHKVNHKLLYFKRKCQNAALEKRKLYQDIRLRQLEHNIIIKKNKLKIKQMEEEHKMKMFKLQSTTTDYF